VRGGVSPQSTHDDVPVRAPPAGAAIASLGLLTIVAYGCWYYGFGVLLDPIHHAEGWSRGALGGVFGAAIFVNGIGAAIGGRLLDAAGPRRTFLLAALLGAGGLAAASFQHGILAFGACYAIGGGSIGALGFYHVTLAAAARTSPARPSQAIARLTIIGALSSPIFLPLTAWLVEVGDWRATLRLDAAAIGLAFLVAAACVPDHRVRHAPRGSALEAFRTAWRKLAFRRLLYATLLSGAAADIMLAFQVPIMRAAGLPLAAAATIAGLRGFAQLAGRLPLGLVLRRVSARAALAMSNLLAAVAAVFLLVSGVVPLAVAYSVLAGTATGANSPLQGIYTAELVDRRDLGLLLGVQQALYGIAGACGPILVGVLLALTDSWVPAVVLTSLGFIGAAFILGRPPEPARGESGAIASAAPGQGGEIAPLKS
jgi:predicted MFS family arabinose efflux permease